MRKKRAEAEEHRAQIDGYRLLRYRGMSRNQAAKATGMTYTEATIWDRRESEGAFQPPVAELDRLAGSDRDS